MKTFAEQCEEIMAQPPEVTVLDIKPLSQTSAGIQQLAKEEGLAPDVVVALEINGERKILFMNDIIIPW